MCVYMHVCVHACVCTCVHACVHVCVYMLMHACAFMCVVPILKAIHFDPCRYSLVRTNGQVQKQKT